MIFMSIRVVCGHDELSSLEVLIMVLPFCFQHEKSRDIVTE